MSLITDALKTAQREKTAQGGPSLERKLLEGFFPYGGGGGGGAVPDHRRRLVLVGASAIVLIVVAGGTWYVRRNATPALLAHPVSHPAVPVSPSVVAASKPTPQAVVQAGASQTAAASASGAKAREAAAAAAAPDSSAPPRRVARTKSQVTIPVTRTDSDRGASASGDPVANAPAANVTVSAPGARPGDQLFADAYAAQQAGNFDRAQELYEKAIQTPPVPADVFNNYGALLVQRGNVQGGIRLYRRAIQIDKDNVKAWINLGAALDQNGTHAEATSAFEQALTLDANNVPVKLELAEQYQDLGDSASAKRLIEDALRTAPKDPMAHYKMAALLERQNDVTGALREYDAFLEFGASSFNAETLDEVRRHETALRGRRP